MESYFERLKKIKLDLLPKEAVAKKKVPIKKISDKKKAEMAKGGGDDSLDIWFNAMKKKLKGKCMFCNCATTWKNDELWRCAIAHLLPKSKFKSVATNDLNWVELCWDCHTEFDQAKITWELIFDSDEWNIIKEQLHNVMPMVAAEERKHKTYRKLEELLYLKTKEQ